MIVRVNGRIVDILNEKKQSWNAMEMPINPNISIRELDTLIEKSKELVDSPSTYIQWKVESMDMTNYHFLSNSEVTELFYRCAKWSVNEVLVTLQIF